MRDQTELEEALRRGLDSMPEVIFAYLFGSRATGRARADSDIDVAVYQGGRAGSDHAGLWRKLVTALSKEVAAELLDLVVLDGASVLLRHQVLREGRLLLCRDRDRWAEFFVQTAREYADTARMRELHLRATRERILGGKGFGQSRDIERSIARVRDLLRKD